MVDQRLPSAAIHFTNGLAVEVRERGVQVFASEPGTVRTPMNDWLLQVEAVLYSLRLRQ
jgi:NAD(P)-dependent dehydrogenase (short-subunit alcohol dehydrogenase family)